MSRPARFASVILYWNLAGVLWGVFVKATGSGAGSGNRWSRYVGEMVGTGQNANRSRGLVQASPPADAIDS